MQKFLAIVALAALAACANQTADRSGLPNAAPGGALRFAGHELHPGDTPGALHWLASEGIGEAITDCGGHWVAISGGAYSATATDIGAGYPGPSGSTWIVYTTNAKAYVTSYALCAPADGLSSYFYRVVGSPLKKKTTAVASCGKNDMLVAGWTGYGTFGAPVVTKGVPTGWVAGGNAQVNAYAECATHQETSATGMVLVTKSSGAGRLFIGCGGPAGDNDDVVGSFFGNASSGGSGTLGPPASQYPGLSNGTGSTGPTGVWFANKKNIVGWVVCQEDV